MMKRRGCLGGGAELLSGGTSCGIECGSSGHVVKGTRTDIKHASSEIARMLRSGLLRLVFEAKFITSDCVLGN